MTESEIREKIAQYEDVYKDTKNSPISFFPKSTKVYIVKKREIRISNCVLGFCLDDEDSYIECITSLGEEKGYMRLLSIFAYIQEKFGTCANADKRWKFYSSFDWDSDQPISIKEFYGTDMAMCTERASFTHNILKLLGYDTELIVGHLINSGNREGHCYNIYTTSKGKHVLFDTAYWILLKNNEGISDAVYAHPIIVKISEDEYSRILGGRGCFLAEDSIIHAKGFEPCKRERLIYL